MDSVLRIEFLMGIPSDLDMPWGEGVTPERLLHTARLLFLTWMRMDKEIPEGLDPVEVTTEWRVGAQSNPVLACQVVFCHATQSVPVELLKQLCQLEFLLILHTLWEGWRRCPPSILEEELAKAERGEDGSFPSLSGDNQ